MSDHLHIIPGKQAEKVLNKEQKRFNTLVSKISALRKDIEETKELDIELRIAGEERLRPAEEKADAVHREWILALHHHPAKAKLAKKMAEKFPLVMLEELAPLLKSSHQDDVEMQELYVIYEGSGRSFEEIVAEEVQEENLMHAQMMNTMFGLDLDPEDFNDPEKLEEKLKAKQSQFEEQHKQRQEEKNARKKNTFETVAAEKRKAAADSVKKTTKQIYLELVRNFHPDKEPDEQKRAEKTEIMKQITVAYQADDHLRLLELQMNLLASRDNIFADFDNAQLKYFNQTLQQQVKELELELYYSSPEGNGNKYARLFSPNRTFMLKNIEKQVNSLKKIVKGVRHNLSIIGEEKMFNAYIKDFDLEDNWGF